MITSLSKSISLFLCRKNVIAQEDIAIYQYGFETIISTVIGFLITIGIGLILKMIWLSILYYGIFVAIRQMTGGYHADSYLKCNLIFAAVSFFTMGMTKMSACSEQYTFTFHLLLLAISTLVVWFYTPVENEYKELDEVQRKRNHWIGFISTLALSGISCALFWATVEISILIALTLFMIAMLIVIAKIKERGEEDE